MPEKFKKLLETLTDQAGDQYPFYKELGIFGVNDYIYTVYSRTGLLIVTGANQQEAHERFKQYALAKARRHEVELIDRVLDDYEEKTYAQRA